MKNPNFLYPIIVVAIGALFLFTLPELDAVQHNHEQAIQYSPNPFEADSVEICGDTAYVKAGRHIELTDWRREWIEQEPIVDKPF